MTRNIKKTASRTHTHTLSPPPLSLSLSLSLPFFSFSTAALAFFKRPSACSHSLALSRSRATASSSFLSWMAGQVGAPLLWAREGGRDGCRCCSQVFSTRIWSLHAHTVNESRHLGRLLPGNLLRVQGELALSSMCSSVRPNLPLNNVLLRPLSPHPVLDLCFKPIEASRLPLSQLKAKRPVLSSRTTMSSMNLL